MKHVDMEIFSESTNCPVVRMPQRKFPGVVLQGDSLNVLLDLAEEMCELSIGANNSDLIETAVAMRDKIAAYVNIYEKTMQEHGLGLPYSK